MSDSPQDDPVAVERERHDAALRSMLTQEAGRHVLSEFLSQTGVLSIDVDPSVRGVGIALMDHIDDVMPGEACELLKEQDARRRALELRIVEAQRHAADDA